MSVDYVVESEGAHVGVDFEDTRGTLVFEPGVTEMRIPFKVTHNWVRACTLARASLLLPGLSSSAFVKMPAWHAHPIAASLLDQASLSCAFLYRRSIPPSTSFLPICHGALR